MTEVKLDVPCPECGAEVVMQWNPPKQNPTERQVAVTEDELCRQLICPRIISDCKGHPRHRWVVFFTDTIKDADKAKKIVEEMLQDEKQKKEHAEKMKKMWKLRERRGRKHDKKKR